MEENSTTKTNHEVNKGDKIMHFNLNKQIEDT